MQENSQFSPLLTKEQRRDLSVWLTVVTDLGQFVENGVVAWTEELVDTIMRVTSLGSHTQTVRLIMAAPGLNPSQVYTDEFYDSWTRWFNRSHNDGLGLRIRDGHDRHTAVDTTFGSETTRALALIYTKRQFGHPQTHPLSRMWATICRRHLPANSVTRPTGWSYRQSAEYNPTLGDWIDRGEIALRVKPHENDTSVPRHMVIIQKTDTGPRATIHSLLPAA